MEILQVVLFVLFSFFVLVLVPKVLRIPVGLLLTFGILVEGFSIYLNGRVVDDRFVLHASWDNMTNVGGFFWLEVGVLFISGILLFLFLLWLVGYADAWKRWRVVGATVVILISLAGMSLPGGVIRSLWGSNLFDATYSASFSQALEENGIENTYVRKTELRGKPGKNILVLYLESMESGFLNDRFAHVTPNLQRLRDRYSFISMEECPGSDWSAGAVYTGLNGIPSFFSFGSGGNQIFQGTKTSELVGVGSVLEVAGYNREFLLGNPEFAGMDVMLKANGFTCLSEKDLPTQAFKTPWGMHDIELFSLLRERLQSLDQKGEPFALYAATIGTHPPNGVYDPRVEQLIQHGDSELEKMAAATDYHVGALFRYLEKSGLLETTEVFLLPDHLMMGMNYGLIEKLGEDRSLYVISTVEKEQLGIKHEPIRQIDLPRLILEGAKVESNAVFYADQVPYAQWKDTLLSNKQKIQHLNEASVKGENLTEGFTVKRVDSGFQIEAAHVTWDIPLPKEGSVAVVELDHKFRKIALQELSLYEAFRGKRTKGGPRLILAVHQGKLKMSLVYGREQRIHNSGENEIVVSAEDIQDLRNWPFSPDLFQLAPLPQPESVVPSWEVTSSAAGNPQVVHPTRLQRGDQTFQIQDPGLYLLEEGELYFFDPKDEMDVTELANRLTTLVQSNGDFGLLVHESGSGPYQVRFQGIGFPRLADLPENMAYFSCMQNGLPTEFTSARTLSLSIPLSSQRSSAPGLSKIDLQDRVIAHAGGALGGQRYTNSLQALYHSYRAGFRKFELDILKTKDGHLVATHDWPGWKKSTGFPGNLPPSLAEFKQYRSNSELTPLDIRAINTWFEKHPDAILVTDKIDDPEKMTEEFLDPSRLEMELFSLEAVKKAQQIGFERVVMSENVLWALEGDKLTQLKKLGVTQLAVSRKSLVLAPQLFRDLKEAGIKVYLFHVNDGMKFNETYVRNYDWEFAYGMYADWFEF